MLVVKMLKPYIFSPVSLKGSSCFTKVLEEIIWFMEGKKKSTHSLHTSQREHDCGIACAPGEDDFRYSEDKERHPYIMKWYRQP
jgi:hypothetical protein